MTRTGCVFQKEGVPFLSALAAEVGLAIAIATLPQEGVGGLRIKRWNGSHLPAQGKNLLRTTPRFKSVFLLVGHSVRPKLLFRRKLFV